MCKILKDDKKYLKDVQRTPLSNMRYCKMKCIPGLFEKFRHALFCFGVNLIGTRTVKWKDLVSAKIEPNPKDEVSGVYVIPLKTENIYLEYIGKT